MFDLVDESGIDLKNYGYKVTKENRFGVSTAFLVVESEKKSKSLGMKKGEYYIINCPNLLNKGYECYLYITEIVKRKLKKVLKDEKIRKTAKILLVGLGNPEIISDRLGKEVFDGIEIDALSKTNRFFKFCPNIFFSTGIDTKDMVKMFAKHLKADLIFLIDSLTTSSLSRLGTSFQITTSGITPGSGLNRFGSEISFDSIGVPCISIGVPFMIFSNAINEEDKNDIILSPKDIKENVEICGYILSKAISEVIK